MHGQAVPNKRGYPTAATRRLGVNVKGIVRQLQSLEHVRKLIDNGENDRQSIADLFNVLPHHPPPIARLKKRGSQMRYELRFDMRL
jgi:hypothetical protein